MNAFTLLDLGGFVFQSSGISNKKIHWNVISRLNKKYGHDLNIGEDVFPAFLNEYNTLPHQSLSGKDFLESVFDTLEVNTELIGMIRAKSDIVIVSDNYKENIACISERYDFNSWSIKQVYSFDYQMHKSNPLFFKALLDDLEGHTEKNMVLIDDSPPNIQSAQKNATKGIQFMSNDQLKKEWNAFNGFEK